MAGKENEIKLTDNARKVLAKRYLAKNEKGEVIEKPEDLFRRVAKNIAQADKLYDKKADINAVTEEFYGLMANMDFLPNSPTLMNAGRELQQLSACFVLPIEDSMESIFETIKSAALIHKSGGGTGFSFSRLRAKNSTVKSTGGVASGPISFLKVFNSATEAVKQGGTRRGANMGILRVDHPDIMEFIKCKENDKEITNFNISVAVTDDFMKKLQTGTDYDLIDPHSQKPVGKLNSKEVFDLMVKMAWKNGEPGVIFIDRMNQYNPTPEIGLYESTNPCGEQVLLPHESCNLGSINVANMVKDNDIDWEKLATTVRSAVHFLDNVIDMNNYPLKKISQITKANRKIGLGVMGFADMLVSLGIPYNSEKAIEMGEKVMQFILKKAREESKALAKKRGAFPNFDKSVYKNGKEGVLRNATLTTIAPTGTLSIIAGCSSGIEPLFALSYIRKILDNEQMLEVNPTFKDVAEERGFFSPELMKTIAERGSINEIEEIPEDVRKTFVISHDISAMWHVRMQSAFQKYTDNAVSKTVNFPQSATEDDIREVYLMSYKQGCKGVTIYRDKSRDEQVLNIASTALPKKKIEVSHIVPRTRPNVIMGTTTKITTGCGNLYVTINEDEEHLPFEVFMQMGKAGGCAMSQLEAIGRLLSLALRSGIETTSIIEQLKGIRCPSPSWEKGGRIFSCSDAIARVVEQRLIKAKEDKKAGLDIIHESGAHAPMIEHTGATQTTQKKKLGNIVGVCPDCGAALYQLEGCNICHSCGYSKCG